jgi:hypothetical protein
MRQPLSKCLSPTVPLSLSSTTRPRHETPPRHSSPIHKRSGDANARDNVRAATDPFWSVLFQPRTRVPSYFIRIHHFSCYRIKVIIRQTIHIYILLLVILFHRCSVRYNTFNFFIIIITFFFILYVLPLHPGSRLHWLPAEEFLPVKNVTRQGKILFSLAFKPRFASLPLRSV